VFDVEDVARTVVDRIAIRVGLISSISMLIFEKKRRYGFSMQEVVQNGSTRGNDLLPKHSIRDAGGYMFLHIQTDVGKK
jgi:hypothetical protein